MDTWNWLFGHTQHVNVWQECARAILIFAYGWAATRIAGRRLFGKWSALDIILSVMVGSGLSRALTGSAPLIGTLAATTLMLVLHWFLSHLAARSPRASQILEGSAIEIARDGQLHFQRLHRHAVSDADLNESIRQSGVGHVSGTALLMLEPSGKITVIKSQSQSK